MHVQDTARDIPPVHRKHRGTSLHLIDDLTNRPMDQLYSDSRLAARPRSSLDLWGTRIVVFIVCIAVGFLGSQFVRLLNTDPRKEVRNQLASQLESSNDQVQALEKEINSLRTSIDKQSAALNESPVQVQVRKDDMVAGLTKVEGEGIVLTIANPLAASGGNNGALPRETSTTKLRVVTDYDLQQWVSLLWFHGAEAIAINGNRLGALTAIRTAGSSILIDTNAISSPYVIEAIGNPNELAKSLGEKALPSLYADYHHSGMYPQIDKKSSITLPAATMGKITSARRIE